MFLALTNEQKTDPVVLSDPLDTNSFTPAPARALKNPFCLNGSSGIKD